jgi:hypothetical protein
MIAAIYPRKSTEQSGKERRSRLLDLALDCQQLEAKGWLP